MAHFLARLRGLFDLTYGQKLFLLATVPLVIAVTLLTLVVVSQSRQLADREISPLESQWARRP